MYFDEIYISFFYFYFNLYIGRVNKWLIWFVIYYKIYYFFKVKYLLLNWFIFKMIGVIKC